MVKDVGFAPPVYEDNPAGIAESVPEGRIMSGVPGLPHRTWLKSSRILPRLPELRMKILALRRR